MNLRVSKTIDFYDIPEVLNSKGTKEDYLKAMKAENSEISISKVKFTTCKNDVAEGFDENG